MTPRASLETPKKVKKSEYDNQDRGQVCLLMRDYIASWEHGEYYEE